MNYFCTTNLKNCIFLAPLFQCKPERQLPSSSSGQDHLVAAPWPLWGCIKRITGYFSKNFKITPKTVYFAILLLLILIPDLYAGTSDVEFQGLDDKVQELESGNLARAISKLAFIGGAIVSLIRLTALPFFGGIGLALGFYTVPGVIDSLVTATI